MSHFSATLQRTYESEGYADATIHSADGPFPVHKNIVCPSSPYFNAAFTNQMRETFTSSISLPEGAVVVDAIIRHVYEQHITWLSSADILEYFGDVQDGPVNTLRAGRLEHAIEILVAADKYDLPLLARDAKAFFCHEFPLLTEPDLIAEVGSKFFGSEGPIDPEMEDVCAYHTSCHLHAITEDAVAWDHLHGEEYYSRLTAWYASAYQ